MIGDLFAEQCSQTPGAVALLFRQLQSEVTQAHEVLSYAKLHALATKVQQQVTARLPPRGEGGVTAANPMMVSVCVERSPMAVAAVLGLCLAAARNAPLPDQRYGIFRM